MEYSGVVYKFYPVIDVSIPKGEVAKQFINVLWMQNTRINTLGADYDGDTVSVRTVFSQEANSECARLMHEPTDFVNSNGTNVRTTTKEALNTLYIVTKN
jgi:hypothetical protein